MKITHFLAGLLHIDSLLIAAIALAFSGFMVAASDLKHFDFAEPVTSVLKLSYEHNHEQIHEINP